MSGLSKLITLDWHYVSLYVRRHLGRKTNGVNIVVCGPPRAGTSLVFSQTAKALPDFTLALPKKEQSRELSASRYCDRTGNLIGKDPADVLRIAEIKRKTTKKTHFIISLRDPRDILVSRHQWHNPENYWVYPERAISTADSGKRARFGLLEYLKAVETAGQHIDRNTTVTVLRYEDLTTRTILMPEVLASLGLSAVDSGRQISAERLVYSADERASSSPLENSNKWRLAEHREKIMNDFSSYPELFRYIKLFGYDTNQDWFEELRKKVE